MNNYNVLPDGIYDYNIIGIYPGEEDNTIKVKLNIVVDNEAYVFAGDGFPFIDKNYKARIKGTFEIKNKVIISVKAYVKPAGPIKLFPKCVKGAFNEWIELYDETGRLIKKGSEYHPESNKVLLYKGFQFMALPNSAGEIVYVGSDENLLFVIH